MKQTLTQEELNTCVSWSDVARLIFGFVNSTSIRKCKKIVEDNALCFAHHNSNKNTVKYPFIIKKCPNCNAEFQTQSGSPREKTWCSIGCVNTALRSDVQHPNYTDGARSYRKRALAHYPNECIVCGFDDVRILDVHHIDENRDNNSIENLIILCPTHHTYCSRGYAEIVNREWKLK